jgi:hypothetical protein
MTLKAWVLGLVVAVAAALAAVRCSDDVQLGTDPGADGAAAPGDGGGDG